MVNKNNIGTLVGPPCRMMDGGKIRPSLQYGWSGWIMNMPIHTRCDSLGSMQIEVTLRNAPKNIGRARDVNAILLLRLFFLS